MKDERYTIYSWKSIVDRLKRSSKIIVIFILSLSHFSAAAGDLASDLQNFDVRLVELSLSKNPQERAAAISGLARIGSPKYEEVRNRLLDDQDFIVQKALLEALPYMLDVSSQAKQLLIRSLRGESEELISLASNVFGPHIDVPYDFKDLWNGDKPLRLWREYKLNVHYNFYVTNLTGVGKIKPWKDPSWQQLAGTLQQHLLLRAGTREAVDILKKEFSTEENFWVHAELVDPMSLNELLDDSNPAFKKYASFSLFTGADPAYINRLKSKVEDALKSPGGKPEIIEIDGISLYLALPYLETSTLKLILKTDLGLNKSDNWQHFARVMGELDSRGESFTLRELTPENFSHLEESHLQFFQMGALIREKSYAMLPAFLQKLISTKSDYIATLSHSLALSPDFLSSLPEQVAHDSYLILKPSIPTKFEWKQGRDDTESLLRIVGMITRGKDATELWEKWQRHPSPFMEQAVYIPVLWGFNKRSAELRKILGAPYTGGAAFDHLEEFYFKLKNRECRTPSNLIYEFPVALPVYPESIWQADLSLAKSILENFDQVHSDQFAVQFLKTRGIEISAENPGQSLPHLLDNRYIARQVLWNWIKDRLPYALNIDWIFNYRGIKESLNSNQMLSSRNYKIPGPTLSDSQKKWLNKQIVVVRKDYLKRQIEQFYNPMEMLSTLGIGPGPTPIYAAQPDDFFLSDSYGSPLLPELEHLAQSVDPNLQYAALWALWNFNHDKKIPGIWLRDATNTGVTSTDNQLKARALFVLQKIRYKPAALLFPTLLKDPDRRLRQVALFGIQAFKLIQKLPEVKQLIQDPDAGVAETALATLGSFPTPENRELLFIYLKGSERQSFVAMNTLIHFREHADIDAIANLLKKDDLELTYRNSLYEIAKEITNQNDGYINYMAKDDKRITREEIEGWLGWWAQVRELPIEERIKAGLKGSSDKSEDPDAESWWDFHSSDNIWTILQRSLNNEKTISILLEAYPEQTKRFLFSEFLKKIRTLSYDSVAVSHEILIRISGEDFGNPYTAQCEVKDQIISDWVGWAKQNDMLE